MKSPFNIDKELFISRRVGGWVEGSEKGDFFPWGGWGGQGAQGHRKKVILLVAQAYLFPLLTLGPKRPRTLLRNFLRHPLKAGVTMVA